MYYVYLLQSQKDRKFYIGHTKDIKRRLREHNSGIEKSTKSRTPFHIVGYEIYQYGNQARWREYQLKKSAHQRKKFIDKFVKVEE